MPVYRLVQDLKVRAGTTWTIERTAPCQQTTRIRFEGTRKEADAEVIRLNQLAGPTIWDNTIGVQWR